MRERALILATIALFSAIGMVAVVGFVTGAASNPTVSLEELREQDVIFLEEHDIYVVYNEGDPLALSNDAQHMEMDFVVFCPSSQLFESPQHGEKFDKRGFYFAGPARRGLDRYEIREGKDVLTIRLQNRVTGPPRGAGPPEEPSGAFCLF